jgi:hypothetical protein
MGIALAWRRGDSLPTLQRLRELAIDVAGVENSRDASRSTRR